MRAFITLSLALAASGHALLGGLPVAEFIRRSSYASPVRAGYDGPPPQYHRVRQDHFDGTNTNTWLQAYYVNDTFWKGDVNAPVFICMGGEGPPLTGRSVVDSVHCSNAIEWLPAVGGIMFALEHRYYGCHNASACPVDFSAPANGENLLRFLSSRQALADAAMFVSHMTQKYHFAPTNKWVSWGGSYPGMLAGWLRLQYPHLVHASVSSSAPVLAQVDNIPYNNIVAAAYAVSDNNVGGSTACQDAIRDGHQVIGRMLRTSAGRERLASLFPQVPSADWLTDPTNQRSFAGEGVAFFPAQSNDPSCTVPACNIASVCRIMLGSGHSNDTVAALAQVANTQTAWLQEAVARVVRLVVAGLPDFWSYQTCTEFGFYQTCEVGTSCFFTQGLDVVADEVAFCATDYKLSAADVAANVAQSNVVYGGLHSGGSRILYVNGEVDPWHGLSVLQPQPGLPALWVPGASHHAWTHAALPTDQPSVVTARQQIRSQVQQWLQEA
eukprot:TRINITY_DN7618_c0_g2_i1.p1 TRINITY_DN7618_c0_g2~~TRINITY_DN7618_c0_g2_i1.p1  ORF type:complete len:497 (+),score=93.47 TRINITY_DN7618_c0_g2_i1:61-1551(+)